MVLLAVKRARGGSGCPVGGAEQCLTSAQPSVPMRAAVVATVSRLHAGSLGAPAELWPNAPDGPARHGRCPRCPTRMGLVAMRAALAAPPALSPLSSSFLER